MKTSFAVLIFVFFLTFSAFGQNEPGAENSIQMIESLTKKYNIELCEVFANGLQWGGKKYPFRFENNFLVVELDGWGKIKEAYYNMDKLMHFYIDDDRIVFNFHN